MSLNGAVLMRKISSNLEYWICPGCGLKVVFREEKCPRCGRSNTLERHLSLSGYPKDGIWEG